MPFMEREKLVSSDISLETSWKSGRKVKPKGAGSTLPPGKGSGPMRSFCSEDKKTSEQSGVCPDVESTNTFEPIPWTDRNS